MSVKARNRLSRRENTRREEWSMVPALGKRHPGTAVLVMGMVRRATVLMMANRTNRATIPLTGSRPNPPVIKSIPAMDRASTH